MKVKTNTLIISAALISATLFNSAYADDFRQGGRRQPQLVLFAGKDFRGESVVINRNNPDLRSINFDEKAWSLVATGKWEVCLDPNYGVRCRTYEGRVDHLESFKGRVSSVRFVGWGDNDGYGTRPDYPRPDYPRFNGTRGSATTFYAGTINGYDANKSSADAFCRAQGNNYSVYYDGYGRTLQDVLCK